MPKYFKFLGVLELIFAAIGFFFYIFGVGFIFSIPGASELDGSFVSILGLIAYAIFAPALGLLLIAFGEILEKVREIRNAQLEAGQFTSEEKSILKEQLTEELRDK